MSSLILRSKRALLTLLVTLIGIHPPSVQAITVDDAVPEIMDFSEPGLGNFLLGSALSYTRNFDESIIIGQENAYNQLTIKNQANITANIVQISSIAYSHDNSLIVEDNNTSLAISSSFHVGFMGSDSKAEIRKGATLTTGYTYIGQGAAGNINFGLNNSLLVDGEGSSFITSLTFFMGSNGLNNTFTISNGAYASSGSTSIGSGAYTSLTANNNAVFLDGKKSRWATGDFILGGMGSANSFLISNGGGATSKAVIIGIGDAWDEALGNSNTTIVNGAGSSWEADSLIVGDLGSYNKVTVSDGGKMALGSIQLGVGLGQNPTFGRANQIIITDAGSELRIRDSLIIGSFGSFNSLEVAEGALLVLDGSISFSLNTGRDNYLGFNKGYFAWKGDRAADFDDLVRDGLIRVFDGENWVVLPEYHHTYFATSQDAYDVLGYGDLGGYTIFSTEAFQTIPEPSTWAMFGIAAIGLMPFLRRSSRSSRIMALP